MKYLFLMAFFLVGFGVSAQNLSDKEKLKAEIKNIENSFAKYLQKNGAAAAFYEFAAENAVIKRERDTLIVGREAIKKYYEKPSFEHASAVWEPDCIEVSGDGTMAYTYGKYEWTMTNEKDEKKTFSGVFHTVWLRMPDGKWKYVWD
jgi:ketosteroid isomerase-like protein